MVPIEHGRRFEIEYTKLEVSTGLEKWGANTGEVYFCLHLGRIIKKHNC